MVDISTLPNSVDELKEVIKGLNSQMLAQHQKIQLLEDKEMRLKMGQYSREIIEKKYSYRVLAKKWEEVIKNVLE